MLTPVSSHRQQDPQSLGAHAGLGRAGRAVQSPPAMETSCKSLDSLGLLGPCESSCSGHTSGEAGLRCPLSRPPASSRRKRPSTWNCLLCGLPAHSAAAASPSIMGCGGHSGSHHRLTRARGKLGTRGMQGHCSTGSGLRVSRALPLVVGAVAFRHTEAAVPQSSMQLAGVGISLFTCCPTQLQEWEAHPPCGPPCPWVDGEGLNIFPLLNILSLSIAFFYSLAFFFSACFSS